MTTCRRVVTERVLAAMNLAPPAFHVDEYEMWLLGLRMLGITPEMQLCQAAHADHSESPLPGTVLFLSYAQLAP